MLWYECHSSSALQRTGRRRKRAVCATRVRFSNLLSIVQTRVIDKLTEVSDNDPYYYVILQKLLPFHTYNVRDITAECACRACLCTHISWAKLLVIITDDWLVNVLSDWRTFWNFNCLTLITFNIKLNKLSYTRKCKHKRRNNVEKLGIFIENLETFSWTYWEFILRCSAGGLINT